jgi:hypothetical protein
LIGTSSCATRGLPLRTVELIAPCHRGIEKRYPQYRGLSARRVQTRYFQAVDALAMGLLQADLFQLPLVLLRVLCATQRELSWIAREEPPCAPTRKPGGTR